MAATLPPPVLDQVTAVLAGVPLFEDLSRDELQMVARLVRGRTIEPGELLFMEGDPADKLYIVQSGAVELLVPNGDSDPEVVAIKRAGDAFGELALLFDTPRPATARGRERTNLLVISRTHFTPLFGVSGLTGPLVSSFAHALEALRLRTYSRTVQAGLLPTDSPQTAEFELGGGLAHDDSGSAQCIWDAFPFKGGGVIYAVMTARGSTLPAANVIAVTRALLREIAASEERFERVLTRLNKAVHGGIGDGGDTTIAVGLIHIVHVITFAIAGTQAALVARNNGELLEIGQHGPPIGVVADYSYGTTRAELEKADFALVISATERALLTGAVNLIRSRASDPMAETAPLLAGALARASQRGHGEDVGFIIARRT